MNQKDKLEVEKYLSKTRLATYSPNSSLDKQIKEYRRNIKLCESFYSELNYFEITFRNAIDVVLTNFVNGGDWMTILPLNKDSLHKIANVKKRLTNQNKVVTHDRIVSELTFGFWTNLFSKKYNQCKFQSVLVKTVFINYPKQQRSVQNIQKAVDEIRELRNRVYHYERICHYPNLKYKHKRILECTYWVSPAIYKLSKKK